MTKKRFIIDDVGTLIDIQTRNTYDYVSDVCPLLNELNEENEQLYELIDFANTLIAFKTSESCQKEWEKRLKELV